MNEQHDKFALPSGLFLERWQDKDGDMHYFIVRKGWDEWHPGVRYVVTKDEYDALLPLARRVEE